MSVALVAAIAAGYSLIGSNESVNMSELTQANVEALADDINAVVGCSPVDDYVCSTPRKDYDDKAPIIYPDL